MGMYQNLKTLIKLERVQFHLTNKCNLSCIFCGARNFETPNELPDKKWIEITKELCELEPKQLTISGGGEPLIRGKLVTQIVDMIKGYRIEGALITNGTLLTRELAEKLVKNEWKEYRVSLHSSTAKLDEFLRGKKSAFFLSLKGFRKINYFKRRFKTSLPKTEIWMVITRFNFKEIERMIELAKRFEVNGISLKMVNELGDQNKFSLLEDQLNWLKDFCRLNHLMIGMESSS